MIRRPPRSTQSRSSAASDVYKRQEQDSADQTLFAKLQGSVLVEPLHVIDEPSTPGTGLGGVAVDGSHPTAHLASVVLQESGAFVTDEGPSAPVRCSVDVRDGD